MQMVDDTCPSKVLRVLPDLYANFAQIVDTGEIAPVYLWRVS